jgi:hypothetical protein
MSDKDQAQKAIEMIKAVYDDGFAEINGRRYEFNKTTHNKRLQVWAFYSANQELIQRQDFSFFTTPEWARCESVINDIVTFEGDLLSRRPGHWDEYPEDFLTFVTTALAVISYPFIRGGSTG